ncbi:MAG TPA: hypothetical protein VK777_23370 [Reyranella sp.]|jgi:hypothetical protein|nr:hypothetical protein [Reyranella sp.]
MSDEWCGWPIVDDSASWETAQQILTDAELSDGLPLVPPTRRRLEAMVAGVAGRGESRGLMPPLFGDITPESIAYQCVIAGCRPAELPIVLAAAEAILEPDFNLLGIATTTGTACVALCVHGAIARQLGVNAGTNCLGPGNRANASIGRALQLSIRNVGGARSDVGDMATMGQPGKYTLCFAERNDGPFPTFTERRGLGADASAITVMGISGTAEVLPGDGEGATPEAILSPIATAMRAAIVMSSMSRRNERGEQVFLLPLEMAHKIVRHDGWDIARVQRYLFDEGQGVARAPDAIHAIVTGGAGYKMSYLPIWGGGSQTVTRSLHGAS